MFDFKDFQWLAETLGKTVTNVIIEADRQFIGCKCIKRSGTAQIEDESELPLFFKHYEIEEKYAYKNCSERIFGADPAEDLIVLHNWSQGFEANYYQFLIKHAETIKNIPKCYGVVDKNLIIIEDLSKSRQMKCLKMMDPQLSKDEVGKILKAYSQFHISSKHLAETMKSELNSHSFYCATRDKRVAYCVKASGKDMNGRYAEILEGYDFSTQSKKNLNLVKDAGLSKLSALFSNYTTILQGDANPNNIFASEDLSEVIFIDFQEGGFGNPMSDIAWFIITSNSISKDEQLECLKDYFLGLDAQPFETEILQNDFYVGLASASYLMFNALGVIPSNDRLSSWYGKLSLSCVEKLNMFDQEIAKALEKLIQ